MDRRAPDPSDPSDTAGSSGYDLDIETDGSGAARSSAALAPGYRPEETAERDGTANRDDTSSKSGSSRFAGVRRRAAALRSGVRLSQFLSVGVLGALFDNGLLIVLYGSGTLPLGIAKLASAEAAILLMFACNEYWTFAGWGKDGFGEFGRRVLTSNLVRLGGVLVATGVLLVLTELGVWYVLANVVGIGVGALLNYVAESLLTWRVHRE